MTRQDVVCDVLGGIAGGALVAYWLVWSAGRLVDPSRYSDHLTRVAHVLAQRQLLLLPPPWRP